ncbi:MAG: MerR family transcriptional regulator [Thermodesulfobacteriota bacterium]|nr:MerR family transcriptional regulator [Thermodesulfobacteriota bacterium]
MSILRLLLFREVARRAGVSPDIARIYEALGLTPPLDANGNPRPLDAAALDIVKLIELARQQGFTLTELKELLANHISSDGILRPGALDSIRDQIQKTIKNTRHQVQQITKGSPSLAELLSGLKNRK